jgi:CDP-glucose 4,6-dehydratase
VEGLVTHDRATAADVTPFGALYDGRRVLVTGDTGFKGAWLCGWLADLGAVVSGYALEPPTDPSLFVLGGLSGEVAHVTGDVRDLAALAAAVADHAPELVLHLAAQPIVRASYADPRGTFETNVMGLVNLFEAVRACPSVRAVVVVTSDKCYENREGAGGERPARRAPARPPFVEEDPLGGHDPYSASKGCAEIVTAAYRRSFCAAAGVRVASARAGNVIGGGDWAADRLVPDCVRALVAREPVVVRRPDAVRPWQHVLEPLAGYLWLGARLMAGDGGLEDAWNLGPDPQACVAVGEVVAAFLAAYGAGSWRAAAAAAGEPHEAGLLTLDSSLARDRLGLQPVWKVDEAVARTAAWYRAWAAGGDARAAMRADVAAFVATAYERGLAWATARAIAPVGRTA